MLREVEQQHFGASLRAESHEGLVAHADRVALAAETGEPVTRYRCEECGVIISA